MKRLFLILIACLFFGGTNLLAQAEDPVLFTVDGTPVTLSEFNYIYNKTNGKKADYSRASLEEYLDLYVKFKLKVRKAKDMQLDTIPSLQQELEGYRRQLANSYLIDKEVTEQLTREVYDRSKTDVDISHILFLLKPEATKEEREKIYKRAQRVAEKIQKDKNFESMVQQFSDDKATKGRKGRVGYLTTMLPNGFYELENAMYNLKEGEVSDPVRTPAGYHIIRVNGTRPARGEIEVAHILARTNAKTPTQFAEAKIKNVQQQMQEGKTFEEIAKIMSEDKSTAAKGGVLGRFGINRYELAFENAAFELKNDGDVSEPIRTSVGWHLIKRLSKPEMQSYDNAKARIQARIKKDERHEAAKRAMIDRIQEEGKLMEDKKVLEAFAKTLDKEFVTHRWRPAATPSAEVLFTLGGEEVTLGSFTGYLRKASRDRMTMGRSRSPGEVVATIYKRFLDEQTLKYEERQLEKKYPEFKSLMREYEEGILLFEATKILVWDKASQDSIGLAAFHETQKSKYMWGERAQLSSYALNAKGKDLLPKLRKLAAKKAPSKVLAKINKKEKLLTVETSLVEKEKADKMTQLPWQAGAMSEVKVDEKDNSMHFTKIEKIVPPTEKTLKEARGYVVADYQDYLEKQWIETLRDNYKVEINKGVFEELIK
ncbi:MAG: peptidylprolyl isomerase [Bacteroidota bacterium]